MDEFYRPAESRVSAAIAFIVVVYSARKVVGDSGIECLIAALDYVDVPGHMRYLLHDLRVLCERHFTPFGGSVPNLFP